MTRRGDILHIAVVPELSAERFDFLADDLVAKYDPRTRLIEHLDILGFAARFQSLNDTLDLPIEVSMHLSPKPYHAIGTGEARQNRPSVTSRSLRAFSSSPAKARRR
jgi:hypothetical protein